MDGKQGHLPKIDTVDALHTGLPNRKILTSTIADYNTITLDQAAAFCNTLSINACVEPR